MNNFREWLSDNLRYFMLIFGILAVLVAMFFGVKAISARISDDKQKDTLSMDSVVSSVLEQPAAAVLSGAEEVAGAAESVVENALLPAGREELKTDAASPVTALMTSYYDAIGNQDIAAVRELVDVLPEVKAAEISSERLKYSDVKVYTKPGQKDGSYVVYTTYSYSGQDEASKLPGISQSYVEKDENGAERIVFSELDADTQEYLDEVAKDPDVVSLISKVRDEYNAARTGREGSSLSAGGSEAAAEVQTAEPEQETAGDSSGEDEENREEASEDYDDGSEDDGSYDEAEGETEEEPEAEPEDEEEEEWTGSAKSDVNVRSGPGFDYEVISELSEGQEVTVTGEENGWYHIEGDGVEGYVGHSWIE